MSVTGYTKAGADAKFNRFVTPERYGAKGDGTTNDTAAFQAAVDALESLGGGILWVTARVYVVGGLILKNGVVITTGVNVLHIGGSGYQTTFVPPATFGGWVIDTPLTTINGAGVIGVNISCGNVTSAVPDRGGIRLQTAHKCVIKGVSVSASSLRSIYAANVLGCLFENIIVQNFWQNRAPLTANEGALDVRGTDNTIRSAQCNGGDASTVYDPVNFYRCGLYLSCITSWVYDANGEYSDVGIKVAGKGNKLIGIRGDVNAGRGIQVDGIENILSDVTLVSNSIASPGDYDGVYFNGAAYLNTLDNVTLVDDFTGATFLRYVVNDQVNIGSDTTQTVLLPVIKNVVAAPNYKYDLVNYFVAPYRAIHGASVGYPAARPASRFCAGGTAYDSLNLIPVYSDGLRWRNYAGQIVGNILPPSAATMNSSVQKWAGTKATVNFVDARASFGKGQAEQVTCTDATGGAINAHTVQLTGVISGKPYNICVYTRGLTQAATVSWNYNWLDSAGAVIGTLTSTVGATNVVGTPSKYLVTLPAAPAGAVGIQVFLIFTRTGMTVGEQYEFTKVSISPDLSTDYVEP